MTPSHPQEALLDSKTLDQKIWSLTSDDQWHRTSEALILLHQANAQMKAAEQRLAESEKRIKELESLASSDPLTGLLNRRGFEAFFAQEMERTRRHNTRGNVLVVFDLDGFKAINDTYGHQAGDACLKKVGEYLKKKIRTVDGAARLGGDEFAVLLSHTDPQKSAGCLSEIKNALDGLQVSYGDRILTVRASLGVKYVSDEVSYETAYNAADKNLYDNKRMRKAVAAAQGSLKENAGEMTIKNLTRGSGAKGLPETGAPQSLSQMMLNTL